MVVLMNLLLIVEILQCPFPLFFLTMNYIYPFIFLMNCFGSIKMIQGAMPFWSTLYASEITYVLCILHVYKYLLVSDYENIQGALQLFCLVSDFEN